MNVQLYLCLPVFVGLVFFNSDAFSQETKDAKKALDAFINATTKSTEKGEPVPGAEITVEQVPMPQSRSVVIPRSVLTTNEDGEFTLFVTPDQFTRLPDEFQLRFRIRPKDPSKFLVESNSVIVTVKKTEGPIFVFEVTCRSGGTTNKGTFAVNSKAQT